ncbi:MAG: helix-turn-helix domain-containing protein [Verrucomicrobiae bacterium]|nr:helix-turn-helix domain-containing protein [Verrucomicrobiae bacterium]
MSIAVSKSVWERSKARAGDLLVLLRIAEFADDSGRAFPSIARLAEECRMDRSNVKRHIARLRAMGELSVGDQDGPRGTNTYRISLAQGGAKLPPGAGSPPGAMVPPGAKLGEGGREIAPQGGAKSHPEPSMNRQGTANRPPLPPKGGKRRPPDPLPPLPHPGPEFAEAWQRWEGYRRELRKPLTPSTVRAQFKDLAALCCADAIVAIDQSIRNGWSGLFKPNGRGWDPTPDRQPLPRLVENIQIKELT